MAGDTINKISAIAEDNTLHAAGVTATLAFASVPVNLTASALVKTLASLGLRVPMKMTALAAQGQHLRNANFRFHMREVDAALTRHEVPITDRFRLKSAMANCLILGG